MWRPKRGRRQMVMGFVVPFAGATIAAACSDTQRLDPAETDEAALSGGVAMLPSADVSKIRVTATGDTTNLFRDIDDGTSFTSADDDTTVVRNMWAESSASYTVAFSGGPTGTVTDVDVNYRVHATSGATGTTQIRLLSGTTVVATAAPRTVPTAYANFTEHFTGLSVAHVSDLRVEILWARSNTVGYFKLTELWL